MSRCVQTFDWYCVRVGEREGRRERGAGVLMAECRHRVRLLMDG